MRDCADAKIVEPATVAGRKLLRTLEPDVGGDYRRQIRSIESQARTRGAELADEAVRRNQKTEIIWFLEHNKNASDADLIDGVLTILGVERTGGGQEGATPDARV